MKNLNHHQYLLVSGGLTPEQVESLTGKAAGYAAKAAFLGLVATTTTGIVSFSAFIIGGVLAPIASISGTYVMYENQKYISNALNETKIALFNALHLT